jgi:heat shock protein HslJ
VDGSVINYTSIPPAGPTGPRAVINGPDQADAGQVLTYDGSGSTAGSTPIVSYSWNMGDGATLFGVTIQYTYNTAGTYTIQLTVTDQSGLANTASQAVTVRPVVDVLPPTAAIEGPSVAFVGEQVTFSAANSQQGTGSITSYNWFSGDGNNTGPVADSSFTTIYSQPGIYYPNVTVADAGGLSDSASMAITVNATLEGTDWHLTTAAQGTTISLQFANGTLGGFAGCNTYNAGYTTTLAEGPTNSISVGPITSTQSLCDETIMTQEQAYLASLQTASQYTISGTSLTLTTTSGPLTFAAAVATIQPVPATTQ